MREFDKMDWRAIDGLGKTMKSQTTLPGKTATRGESKIATLGGFDTYLGGHYTADAASIHPHPKYKENNTYFWTTSSFGAGDGMPRSVYTEDTQWDYHSGVYRAWSSRVDLFNIRCIKK